MQKHIISNGIFSTEIKNLPCTLKMQMKRELAKMKFGKEGRKKLLNQEKAGAKLKGWEKMHYLKDKPQRSLTSGANKDSDNLNSRSTWLEEQLLQC